MIDEIIRFKTQNIQMNNQTNSTKKKNHSEGAKLFVSAVGVPPRWAVDKLHAAGIPIMNMIGSPNHVKKVLKKKNRNLATFRKNYNFMNAILSGIRSWSRHHLCSRR